MKRLNPVTNLFGLMLTIFLFTGLGFSLVVNRGLAFNPGPLTAIEKDGLTIKGYRSHAEFEKQCVNCHEPLKANLAMKCMDCHTDIADQLKTGQGAHSVITNINSCATCHDEHRGRSYNPTETAYHLFNHSKATFSLNWHQQNFDLKPIGCVECHKSENFSQVDLESCTGCHEKNDKNFGISHLKDFGTDCIKCHDGIDRMKSFDHSTTSFPLEYKHTQVKCTNCHAAETINETPKDCKSCHTEPKTHAGVFTSACGDCHNAESWSPAILESNTFSHMENAKFSLALHEADYQQRTISCITCHPVDINHFDIQICLDCHIQNDNEFMDIHQEQYGIACLDCHDGVDRLSNFDHKNFFPLEGIHEQIQCVDCHAEQIYRGTPIDCWQCHNEPEIHAEIFGKECDDCHTTDAWAPAQLEKHTFPLDHGVKGQPAEITCETCHTTNYIEYTCYNCHEHDPEEVSKKHLKEGITEQDLPGCVQCHPNGKEAGGS